MECVADRSPKRWRDLVDKLLDEHVGRGNTRKPARQARVGERLTRKRGDGQLPGRFCTGEPPERLCYASPVSLVVNFLSVVRRTGEWLGPDSSFKNSVRPAYEAGLELLSRRGGLPWEINGTPCRILPKYRRVMPQVCDSEVVAFLKSQVRTGDVCFDVGANVGLYSLQFANWVGPTGRVFAFEPNLHARKVLRQHVEMSGYADRITIVEQAVSDAEGRAELFFEEVDGKSRLNEPNPVIAATASVQSVAVTTLDNFCQTAGVSPNCLKIDIEGFELQALKGATRMLRSPELKGLVVEMHAPWDSTGAYRRELEAFLQEHEVRVQGLVGQRDPLGEHAMVWLQPAKQRGSVL